MLELSLFFYLNEKNDLIRFAYAQHLLPPEKAFLGNEKRPHPARSSPPVSLRLGHGLALTVHRKVIHYQTAAFGYPPEKAFLGNEKRPHPLRLCSAPSPTGEGFV